MPTLRNPRVTIAVDHALGIFANAFRVLEGMSPGGCVLEFLVYSQNEDRAQVMSRVRVPKSLLPQIRDQITSVL